MTLATVEVPVLDRFSVTAADGGPSPMSQPVRSAYVEEAWLPYLGPPALLFARKCDHLLAHLKDGQQSVAVLVNRWADALGVYPEQILAAKHRLVRFGLAEWEPKGNVLRLHRHWPPVPAAIATPEHRAVLLTVPDLPIPSMDQIEAEPS
jgi:hypothetical protein